MATDSDYERLRGQESPASSRYVPQRGLSRYKPALQTLLPIRITNQLPSQRPVFTLPVDDASFFSFITLHWLTSFLWRAYRGNFQEASLPPIDSCHINSQRLGELLHDINCRTGLKNASMGTLVWRFIRTRLIVATILQITSVLIAIVSPFVVVNYFLILSEPSWADRFTWGGILVSIELFATLVKAWSHSISSRTAGRLRSAFLGVAYKKLLRLADPGPSGHSPQKLLSDADALHCAALHGAHVVTAPLVIAACIAVMWPGHRLMLFVVSATLVTLLLLWVLVNLSSYLAGRVANLSTTRIARLHELTETFMLVKMTVIEKIFTSNISSFYERELGYLVKSMFCDAISESVLQAVPLIASMLLFCRINQISLTVNLLVIVLLFTHVKDSMYRFWFGLRSLSDASTALSYFKEVLLLDDGENFMERQNKPIMETQAVSISGASFTYRNKINPVKPRVRKFSHSKMLEMVMEPSPELVDVTLEISKGNIVGVVGSGKSALLLAVLGQLRATRGTNLRDGTCAYVCGDKPWLIDSYDVRENILFMGRDDDDSRTQPSRTDQNTRYYNTVVTCGLGRDIDAFPLQEKTVVADLSLTRSQTQRIALARAFYADRDIYLLDEPLNAVGAKICEDIFKRAALGLLKDKTIIIATHHTQFLNQCHHVVRVEGSRIVGQGTHDELLLTQPAYADLINQPHYTESEGLPHPASRPSGSKDTLLEPHSQESMYCARGWLVITSLALSLSLAILCTSLVLLLYIVVTYKNENSIGSELSWFTHKEYASVVGMAAILCGLLWRFLFTQTVKRASRRLNSDWLDRLVRAPFGSLSTPRSRKDILHCFTLHTQLLCGGLPQTVERWLENVWLMLGCGGVLLLKAPWSLVPLAALYAICTVFVTIYRGAVLQISEVNISKGRCLQEFVQTTVKGRMTIQSLARHKEFVAQFTNLCDAHASCVYLLEAAALWVSVRIQLLAVLFVGGVLVAVGNDPLSDTGLPTCLLVAWQLGGYTRRTVRLAVAAESGVHALKRSNIAVVGPTEEGEPTGDRVPGIEHGGIAFRDVHIRPALHGATFQIEAGQHIGVFGGGREALVAALFRLVRPSRGEITVGGVDTSLLACNTVRSNLSLVPRGSPLPTADVRSLLDPHGRHLDPALWAALGKVRLGSRVKSLDLKLRRGGEGWSMADREGLWLARAVLDDAKVVVLEECVHLSAEEVREHLPRSTILSVAAQPTAHIALQYDMVVTVAGSKAEYVHPSLLYNQSDSGLSQASSTSSLLETSM